jgi:hypothetical protein
MDVEKISLRAAVEWIAQRWPVPRIEKKCLKDWDYRAGVTELSRPEDLVKAGLLTRLSYAQLRIFNVLSAFRDGNDRCSVSYSVLMKSAVVGSTATVSRAIRHFAQMGLLSVDGGWEKGTGRRSQNQYIFTFDNPLLLEQLTGVQK